MTWYHDILVAQLNITWWLWQWVLSSPVIYTHSRLHVYCNVPMVPSIDIVYSEGLRTEGCFSDWNATRMPLECSSCYGLVPDRRLSSPQVQRLHSNFSDFRQTRCCMATVQIFAVIGLRCKSQGINRDNKYSTNTLCACCAHFHEHERNMHRYWCRYMSIHVDACRCMSIQGEGVLSATRRIGNRCGPSGLQVSAPKHVWCIREVASCFALLSASFGHIESQPGGFGWVWLCRSTLSSW